MTNRNRWPRWIAVVLVGLVLLAVIAWQHETVLLRGMAVSASGIESAPDAQVPTLSHNAPAARTAPEQSAASKGYSSLEPCDRDFKSELREYRMQLGPARTADDALDQLLVDSLAADPEDWVSGAIWRKFEAARKQWPNDVELAWLGFDRCGKTCDREAALRHLLAVDPDNMAAWMVAMGSTRDADDETGFAYALQHAANAKFYDPRTGAVFLHARPLLKQIPLPDSCKSPIALLAAIFGRPYDDSARADLMADGMEAALTALSFTGIQACAPKGLSDEQRRQCTVVLSRVAQGDTMLERLLSVRVLFLLESDPARQQALRERYRGLKWLVAHQSALEAGSLPSDFIARKWSQGEFETYKAIAIERDQWPPPADWLPSDGSRYFILGKDPPPP